MSFYIKDISYRYIDMKKAKILLIGDIHSDIEALKTVTENEDGIVDFAIQTGDLEKYCEPLVPTYFVYGNHEDFGVIELIKNQKMRIPRLILLNAGTVFDIHNIRIAGLSGNFSKFFKDRPRHITREDIKKTMKLKNIDILVTHEAPVGVVFKNGKDYGCELISDIMLSVKPKYLICGHNHIKAIKRIGDTIVISMPYGFKEYGVLDYETGKIEWKPSKG